ncbi:MAG: endonuclease domain-containing protein [Nitrosomonadales bacterium]|nr:endonuclease domain-containing protein [Nitrosomonadales bacterium]
MLRRTNSVTTTRARSLRSGMTDAERLLWQALRYKQLAGHRFRRQFPIGRFIADFVCVEQKLVIELDGGQHQDQVAYDEQRTFFLRQNGWRVLRFWNNDVIGNLDGVLSTIAEQLESLPPP